MALPSIQTMLEAQQTISPFAAQALQQATQGLGRSAEAQQQAALAQLAMTPNITQQASTPAAASTGQAATTGNVSRGGFRNLGFSNLNALASQTPQIQYSPTNIEGGGLGQGIANMFNVQQQAQMRDQIVGMLNQQQQAQQSALAQQAAMAQQNNQAQVDALVSAGVNPQQALGLVASGQGGAALGKLAQIVDATGKIQAQRMLGQRALEVAPQIGQVAQDVPPTPAQQLELGGLYGKDVNVYQPVIDLKAGKEALADAATASQRAELEVQKQAADVESQVLANQFAPFKEQRERQAAEIEKLLAEDKLQEAEDKRSQLASQEKFLLGIAPNLSKATPEQLQQYKLLGQMYGIDAKVFETAKQGQSKVVKIGENEYAMQRPDGTLGPIEVDKGPEGPGLFSGLDVVLQGSSGGAATPASVEVGGAFDPLGAIDRAALSVVSADAREINELKRKAYELPADSQERKDLLGQAKAIQDKQATAQIQKQAAKDKTISSPRLREIQSKIRTVGLNSPEGQKLSQEYQQELEKARQAEIQRRSRAAGIDTPIEIGG